MYEQVERVVRIMNIFIQYILTGDIKFLLGTLDPYGGH